MKKILLIILLTLTMNIHSQDNNIKNKNSNYTESKFSKNNTWNKDGQSTTPPDPSMASGGKRIPISGGNVILVLGLIIYFNGKLKKNLTNYSISNNL